MVFGVWSTAFVDIVAFRCRLNVSIARNRSYCGLFPVRLSLKFHGLHMSFKLTSSCYVVNDSKSHAC